VAIGNHYLITVRGRATASGQPVQNVFVYEHTSGLANYNDVNLAWLESVWPKIKDVCASGYTLDELYTVNLEDVDDFGTTLVGEAGGVVDNRLPTYDTWGFKLTRVSRATQNGRKFLGLVAEGDQNDGDPTAAAAIKLALLATSLYAPITYTGSSANFSPRIWRRPGSYESGTVSAPGTFHEIGSAQFTKITHMDSRDDN
jgi:hypothetical protein